MPSSWTTVIKPRERLLSFDFAELWAYRDLLLLFVRRDIVTQYKQTILGPAWFFIQPALTTAMFMVVFGGIAKIPTDGLPQPLFYLAGIVCWQYFADCLNKTSQTFTANQHIFGKVYFPRLIIPLASVGAGLIDFAISTVILLLLMWYYDVGWPVWWLLAPALVLAVIFTALGVGTLLSALNVAYRDFRYVIPFLIQLWMFVTPVVYPASLVPERWQWLFHLNPMAGLIEGFRAVFLGRPFDGPGLLLSFTVAAVFFLAGVLYFEKVERGFADII